MLELVLFYLVEFCSSFLFFFALLFVFGLEYELLETESILLALSFLKLTFILGLPSNAEKTHVPICLE